MEHMKWEPSSRGALMAQLPLRRRTRFRIWNAPTARSRTKLCLSVQPRYQVNSYCRFQKIAPWVRKLFFEHEFHPSCPPPAPHRSRAPRSVRTFQDERPTRDGTEHRERESRREEARGWGRFQSEGSDVRLINLALKADKKY